jgi:hypothetical protein
VFNLFNGSLIAILKGSPCKLSCPIGGLAFFRKVHHILAPSTPLCRLFQANATPDYITRLIRHNGSKIEMSDPILNSGILSRLCRNGKIRNYNFRGSISKFRPPIFDIREVVDAFSFSVRKNIQSF